MMAAILDQYWDTASGATDSPHLPEAARHVRGPGKASIQQRPLCEDRDGKSERGDDGWKGVGSSGNYEETEDGRTVCTEDEVERRQGTEDGGGDTRCCTQEETEVVMELVSSWMWISARQWYKWRDGRGGSLQYG